VSSPADGTPQGTKHNQNQPDDYEDDPDRPQNGDLGDESDYEQNDAQSDHFGLLTVNWRRRDPATRRQASTRGSADQPIQPPER
jgi:hypothetical protein